MRPLRFAAALAAALAAAPVWAVGPTIPATYEEPLFLAHKVAEGLLPPIEARVPDEPLVVNFADRGREIGRYGGELRTLIGRARDVRYMVVYGYARLVGYDENFQLGPDILKDVEVEDGRIFTLHLREGHKWSDGHPFTTEDFRYWWEDVANNAELSPGGPPELMLVDGEPPVFEIVDETTVRYTWSAPNPRFLPSLAGARPPFIYRPAHFMKQYHVDYAEPGELKKLIRRRKARGWAPLHNAYDNMYKYDNPDLPTLQPWMNMSKKNNSRYVLQRNPFYHRVDPEGRQLPYIDEVEMTVAAGGLIPAKVNRGEVDLQVRGLAFSDAPVLKKGEKEGGYRTLLWTSGAGSEMALYPNQTVNDPEWRRLMRDRRFRIALSHGISRKTINKILFFGVAEPAAVAALPASPLHEPEHYKAHIEYDPALANRLLDEVGLDGRDAEGWRLLPDGRRAELIVETAGERLLESDALELVQEFWAEDLGLKMIFRPLDRDILRNKAYAGESMMPVWFGWNNGVPTADASPKALAPVDQTNFSWPKWGQYFQTMGQAGEQPATPEAQRLMALFEAWTDSTTIEEKRAIWEEMLEIHAREIFAIGLVSAAPQPVVISSRIRNFPETGVYAWEPGSHLGAYRIDELWYDE